MGPLIKKLLISLLIIFVLGFQLYIGVVKRTHHFWPFMHHPMYSEKKLNGDILDVEYELNVGFLHGIEKRITKEDLGLSIFQWNSKLKFALINNNLKDLQKVRQIIESSFHDQLTFIELLDYPAMITENGIEYKESEVIKKVTFN